MTSNAALRPFIGKHCLIGSSRNPVSVLVFDWKALPAATRRAFVDSVFGDTPRLQRPDFERLVPFGLTGVNGEIEGWHWNRGHYPQFDRLLVFDSGVSDQPVLAFEVDGTALGKPRALAANLGALKLRLFQEAPAAGAAKRGKLKYAVVRRVLQDLRVEMGRFRYCTYKVKHTMNNFGWSRAECAEAALKAERDVHKAQASLEALFAADARVAKHPYLRLLPRWYADLFVALHKKSGAYEAADERMSYNETFFGNKWPFNHYGKPGGLGLPSERALKAWRKQLGLVTE